MIIKLPFLPWDLNIQRHARVKNEALHRTSIKRDEYQKIFCIGQNKTGTTSLEKMLFSFGFSMGNQPVGEILSLDWLIDKNPNRIIQYCYTADAFQDAPFSYPELYKYLDYAFPNSKFILTVRESPDVWFKSLVRFHTKTFSSDISRPPNEADLKSALYRYKGYAFDVFSYLYEYPKIPLYDEQLYKSLYMKDNDEKRAYFKGRPNDFIEINLSNTLDFKRLCDFLHVETHIKDFPWFNRSE